MEELIEKIMKLLFHIIKTLNNTIVLSFYQLFYESFQYIQYSRVYVLMMTNKNHFNIHLLLNLLEF